MTKKETLELLRKIITDAIYRNDHDEVSLIALADSVDHFLKDNTLLEVEG